MPKSATTDSGQAKVSVTVRLDPFLREWARANKVNLSELLAEVLTDLRNTAIDEARQRDRANSDVPV